MTAAAVTTRMLFACSWRVLAPVGRARPVGGDPRRMMLGTHAFGPPTRNAQLRAALHAHIVQQCASQMSASAAAAASQEVLPGAQTFRCRACGVDFETRREMAAHFKTPEHLRRKRAAVKGSASGDEDSDDSATSSNSSDGTTATTTTKTVAGVLDELGISAFNSPKTSLRIPIAAGEGGAGGEHAVPQHVFVKTWKALLVPKPDGPGRPGSSTSMVEELLHVLNEPGTWAVLALRDGFFAGAVFDAATGKAVVHKTFQRYTTRRKQGGSQAKHDSGSGHAKSAGANLRRAQAEELRREVTGVLKAWAPALRAARFVFLAVTKENRGLFFQAAAHKGGRSGGDAARKSALLLDKKDPRVVNVPFVTHRPSLKEVTRVFDTLRQFEVTADDVLTVEAAAGGGAAAAAAAAAGSGVGAGPAGPQQQEEDQEEDQLAAAGDSPAPAAEELPFCAICLDAFGALQCFRLECGHRFHAHCCSMWLDEEGTCPVCRESVGTAATIGIVVPFSRVHLAALTHRGRGGSDNDGGRGGDIGSGEDGGYGDGDEGSLQALLRRLPAHAINLRCGEHFETALHCAARNNSDSIDGGDGGGGGGGGAGAAEAVRLVLAAGANPAVKNVRGQTAYQAAVTAAGGAGVRAVRAAFQAFRVAHPDQWDYDAAGVPAAVSAGEEEARKARLREKRRLKRERQKQQKRKADAEAAATVTAAAGGQDAAAAAAAAALQERRAAALADARLSQKLETVAVELCLTPVRLVHLVSRNSVDIATSIQSVYELLSAGVPGAAVLDSLTTAAGGGDDDDHDDDDDDDNTEASSGPKKQKEKKKKKKNKKKKSKAGKQGGGDSGSSSSLSSSAAAAARQQLPPVCAMCSKPVPRVGGEAPRLLHGVAAFCSEPCFRQYRRNLHANAAAARIKAAKARTRAAKAEQQQQSPPP